MNEYRAMNGINDNAVDERDITKTMPDIAGQQIAPYHLQTVCHENLQPSWNAQHFDIDGGKMDFFMKTGNLIGTSTLDPNGTRAIGYFDWTDLPYYYSLAFQFATSDRWFSSVLGPTDANRMYTYGATSLGWTSTPYPPSGGYPNFTIFDLLDQAGISWKYYYQFTTPLHIPYWAIYQRDRVSSYLSPITSMMFKSESTFPCGRLYRGRQLRRTSKAKPGNKRGTREYPAGRNHH